MSDSQSPRLKTAHAYLHAFSTLSRSDFLPLFHPNFKHTFLPACVAPPAPLSGDQFATHLASLSNIMSSFPVTATSILEDEAQNAVVMFATSEVVWRTEAMGEEGDEGREESGQEATEWEYEGTYVFNLWFAEDGRIERVVEFVDSLGTEKLRGLMKKARANVAARERAEGKGSAKEVKHFF